MSDKDRVEGGLKNRTEVIQLILSSAFEDPSEIKSLSPDVQKEVILSKSFEFRGLRYGLESLFVPRGYSVAIAIIGDEKKFALAYGFGKAKDSSPESLLQADKDALADALRKAQSLLSGIATSSGAESESEAKREEISDTHERTPEISNLSDEARSYSKSPKVTESKSFEREISKSYERIEGSELDEEISEPKREIRSKPYSSKGMKVNTYQRRFFSLVAKLNWSLDKAKSFLKKHTGKESTKDVEPEEWNKVLALLEEQLKLASREEVEEDEWEELFK